MEIRVKINEIEMKVTTETINETKSWLLEKINKTDKSLARLVKKKREKAQINKNQKLKERNYQQHQRNTKIHKRLLQTIIYQ